MAVELIATAQVSDSMSEGSVEFDLPGLNKVDSNDVHAFENALFKDPFADGIMSKLGSVSGSLSDMKIDFEKSLKKAAETANSGDILDSMRKLSDYTLQTTMIAKAAGKTSQAIDKLTNLS